ncbi:8-oxo-dGTP diphosphatase [Enteractinococcus coprophilus]|uniref:8-oxo-dGTP diphosphatase n=2 Tax=Enteractinococcus coprophilus TaxID=1027633 RepID=A0A543AK06_9MICC|nr:8-oxo-dGTP diphosphatase [Enteractinococcus coprophilus]
MSAKGLVVLTAKLTVMQHTFTKPVVVGAAILDDATRPTQMLAARRKAPKSLAGYWEFPGGKVEPEETPTGALVREIREELGVEIEILEHIAAPSDAGWRLDNGMNMHVYTAIVRLGKPEPLIEHDRLEWAALTASDLHELEWIPADRLILDAILTQLGGTNASA